MIQIDMEMPKSCDRCPLCNEDMYVCEVNANDVEYEWYDGLKPITCPLKEVNNKSVAHWIERDNGTEKWLECDNCHGDSMAAYNYCPNCGSPMI